jgi:hypothetical protein
MPIDAAAAAAGASSLASALPSKREVSEDLIVSPDLSEGKRRRVASVSSRGVANLTPDQLAKKRANDREAQR